LGGAGHGGGLKQTVATRLVIAYVFFFPLDILFISPQSRQRPRPTAPCTRPCSRLCIFLLFVTVCQTLQRLRGPRRHLPRDAFPSAAILASAVFTVETNFFFLFVVYLLFAVATFLSPGNPAAEPSERSSPPAPSETSREAKVLSRAMSLAALSVAAGAMLFGSLLFFSSFPRFSAGYFGPATGLSAHR